MDLRRGTIADPRAKLLELGQAVARAATIDDMIRVVADVAGPLVQGAQRDGAAARRVALASWSSTTALPASTSAVRVVDLSDPTPAAEVVRTGQPVFLASLEELCAALPPLRRAARAGRLGRAGRAADVRGRRAVRRRRLPMDGAGRVHAGTPGARSRRSPSSSATPWRGHATTTTSSPTRVGCVSPTAISTASPPPSPTICASRCASSARTSTCCSTTSTPTSSTPRRPTTPSGSVSPSAGPTA